MIKIMSQNSDFQSDEEGNVITEWDDKKASWIIKERYANHSIDWNGFATGITLEKWNTLHPYPLPHIKIVWNYSDKESLDKSVFNKDNLNPPYTVFRDWGHLDYTKEQAIKLKEYCGFHTGAKCIVEYDNEVIYND